MAAVANGGSEYIHDEEDGELELASVQIQLYRPLTELTSEFDFRERNARGEYIYWLGGGSFGDVFRAKHKEYGDVAVKVARPGMPGFKWVWNLRLYSGTS